MELEELPEVIRKAIHDSDNAQKEVNTEEEPLRILEFGYSHQGQPVCFGRFEGSFPVPAVGQIVTLYGGEELEVERIESAYTMHGSRQGVAVVVMVKPRTRGSRTW